jgi:hypothetical protein
LRDALDSGRSNGCHGLRANLPALNQIFEMATTISAILERAKTEGWVGPIRDNERDLNEKLVASVMIQNENQESFEVDELFSNLLLYDNDSPPSSVESAKDKCDTEKIHIPKNPIDSKTEDETDELSEFFSELLREEMLDREKKSVLQETFSSDFKKCPIVSTVEKIDDREIQPNGKKQSPDYFAEPIKFEEPSDDSIQHSAQTTTTREENNSTKYRRNEGRRGLSLYTLSNVEESQAEWMRWRKEGNIETNSESITEVGAQRHETICTFGSAVCRKESNRKKESTNDEKKAGGKAISSDSQKPRNHLKKSKS